MNDQELADGVHRTAEALRLAMTDAQKAGLRVGVKVIPRHHGGFTVCADVQRPLGRTEPALPPAPESQVVQSGVKFPFLPVLNKVKAR
jgi:hypothetical protein